MSKWFSKRFLFTSDKKGSIGDIYRAKRFHVFEKCISQLEGQIRILDVGGTEYFWENRNFHLRPDVQITLLNLTKQEVKFGQFDSMVGDASNLSQFENNEFDIVFSNSVIEHLYNWVNQEKMASECNRVGRFHFIQTPNKYFFIEPHYRVPFFNFLPKKLAYFLLTKTPIAHGHRWSHDKASRWLSEIQLLSSKQFKILFPNSSFFEEKFLGANKSFTAYNFKKV